MGRISKSQGLAPPSIRRETRAKQARHIINKTIPALLSSNTRARKGVEGSELIVDPRPGSGESRAGAGEDATYTTRKGQGRRKVKGGGGGGGDENVVVREGYGDGGERKGKAKGRTGSIDTPLPPANEIHTPPTPSKTNRTIRILTTDTLTAAHMLTFLTKSSSTPSKSRNTCILNMASPLRPGGGVLSGATSQEEFLCARTTLLPSLHDSFYRLPELGGIWTSDVLVFRSSGPLDDSTGDLGSGERWWVDVVSAGMLRFPELVEGKDGVGRLTGRDRELVEEKMVAVMRILGRKRVRRVVLGAWGCGAYGNPVGDVAAAWKRVLDGGMASNNKKGKSESGNRETWDGLEEVVFAISNRKMAEEFARAFGGDVEVEAGPGGVAEEEDEEEDAVSEELRAKISEMESQVGKVWNPELKKRMSVILEGLRAQLREREGGADISQSDEGEHDKRSGRENEENEVGESSDEEDDFDEGGVVLD